MDRGSSPTADVNTVLIAVDLPGQHTQIGIELRPSRMAAAWILWLTLTLLVMAFWLPSSRRRNRARRLRTLVATSLPAPRRKPA
jgi:hypothetical protein